ncbi:ankyrin repeat domain-containing protein SOWAHA-like protein [Lates japonicus]|uniref:Ankyrin repeat domain-containing protein SOWAHA-like protein n=2 Tax=Lates japonicus TaxID=270547 RepID=A0AAD3M2W3_LATJO|nr:ankyrin repeat domain-containing protein SOWAHA-like protein [Lates japonicus]
MALTQEAILSLLITEGGRVKKSDLVGKFKGSVDCGDPAERERNRELFKTFVNNVAFVREIDGVRYVVIKKMYQHLLESAESREEKTPQTGEQQRPPARCEETETSVDSGGMRSAASEPDQEHANESGENPAELLTPIQLALQRSKYSIRVKRTLNFEIQKQDSNGDDCPRRGAITEATTTQSKPYALPLRMPPSATMVEIRKLKADPDDAPESPKLDASRNKRRPPSVETGSSGSISSPQLRRAAAKSTKASEEHKDTRIPSAVPLEQSEHEWLVKCAAGHWSQVYGLLLGDSQLAEKRDFMSGFTALHWAAKCGNSKMLVKIIDLSRQGGVDVDINAKTHGGYTPLHIAALHDQQYIMTMLVKEFGADVSIRDNCGKKAYHYLHKGITETMREMLGEPKSRQAGDRALNEKDELDLFPDLSKGLHSISRLFQPHVTGHKKKHKQRPGFYSLSEDPGEEREDSSSSSPGLRHRVVSDVFM